MNWLGRAWGGPPSPKPPPKFSSGATKAQGTKRGATMQPILVTGGTGTLGRLVVEQLLTAGRTVRVLSRSHLAGGQGVQLVSGDLATGEGIQAAVEGVEIILHCAGSSKGDEDKAL